MEAFDEVKISRRALAPGFWLPLVDRTLFRWRLMYSVLNISRLGASPGSAVTEPGPAPKRLMGAALPRLRFTLFNLLRLPWRQGS